MKRIACVILAVVLVGCGPTGQVQIERHLVCNEQGQECQTVETQHVERTTTDWIWQVLWLLAVANR